ARGRESAGHGEDHDLLALADVADGKIVRSDGAARPLRIDHLREGSVGKPVAYLDRHDLLLGMPRVNDVVVLAAPESIQRHGRECQRSPTRGFCRVMDATKRAPAARPPRPRAGGDEGPASAHPA